MRGGHGPPARRQPAWDVIPTDSDGFVMKCSRREREREREIGPPGGRSVSRRARQATLLSAGGKSIALMGAADPPVASEQLGRSQLRRAVAQQCCTRGPRPNRLGRRRWCDTVTRRPIGFLFIAPFWSCDGCDACGGHARLGCSKKPGFLPARKAVQSLTFRLSISGGRVRFGA